MAGPRKRTRTRGQSLVEFALIVPVLLTLVGAALDVARIYQAQLKLEAAVRDAAQYVATDPGYTTTGGYYDSTDTANYCTAFPCTIVPSSDAKSVLDAEAGQTFSMSSSQTTCSTPTVWAVLASPSTDGSTGGSTSYPLASTTITACVPFRTLFPYPWFTQSSTWVIHVNRTFSTLVGR